jgi:hypothetical protein
LTAIPAGILFAKAALCRATGGPHRPLDQWRVDHLTRSLVSLILTHTLCAGYTIFMFR